MFLKNWKIKCFFSATETNTKSISGLGIQIGIISDELKYILFNLVEKIFATKYCRKYFRRISDAKSWWKIYDDNISTKYPRRKICDKIVSPKISDNTFQMQIVRRHIHDENVLSNIFKGKPFLFRNLKNFKF